MFLFLGGDVMMGQDIIIFIHSCTTLKWVKLKWKRKHLIGVEIFEVTAPNGHNEIVMGTEILVIDYGFHIR